MGFFNKILSGFLKNESKEVIWINRNQLFVPENYPGSSEEQRINQNN